MTVFPQKGNFLNGRLIWDKVVKSNCLLAKISFYFIISADYSALVFDSLEKVGKINCLLQQQSHLLKNFMTTLKTPSGPRTDPIQLIHVHLADTCYPFHKYYSLWMSNNLILTFHSASSWTPLVCCFLKFFAEFNFCFFASSGFGFDFLSCPFSKTVLSQSFNHFKRVLLMA